MKRRKLDRRESARTWRKGGSPDNRNQVRLPPRGGYRT